MRKNVLVIGIVLIVLGIIGFIISFKLKPAQSGILIDSNPQAIVYINDEQVGTTPYHTQREAGDITVKIVPTTSTGGVIPWSTKLTLSPGIETVIKRDFGDDESQSSGEVLSYEKMSGGNTSLTVVSSPDASQVTVDGQVKGFTPLPIDGLTIGGHKIVVSQPGFTDREINAKTETGYKLTVVATLAQISKPPEPIETPEVSVEVPKVKILSTPTGFLRVRSAPNKNATEEAQVKPGESFNLLEESPAGDWFKIEYLPTRGGWVSSQYTEKQ